MGNDVGRPQEYFLTPEMKAKALELAAAGLPIKKIRAELGIPNAHIFGRLKREDAVFSQAFSEARNEGLEEIADDLLTIADETEDVLRGRLKSENIRWVLSKRKSEVYGDRVDLNVKHTVDISGALAEAHSRIRPASDLRQLAAVQVLEISAVATQSAAGCTPAVPNKTPEDDSDIDIFS